MLNSVVLLGRLTADPELRSTPSGVSVARFRIAVDRSYARAGEDKQTDFIPVVAWRQTADFVSKYFRKGSMIAVQGELRMNTYQDKATGQNRTTYEVMANNVSFTGSKAESGTGAPAAENTGAGSASYSNANTEDFSTVVEDDDFPF